MKINASSPKGSPSLAGAPLTLGRDALGQFIPAVNRVFYLFIY